LKYIILQLLCCELIHCNTYRQGKTTEAEALYEASVITRQANEPNSLRVALCLNNWAVCSHQQGKYDQVSRGIIGIIYSLCVIILGRISILTSTLIYYSVCLSDVQPRELAPLTFDLFLVFRSTKSPHLLNDHFDPELKSVNDLVV
jgi:hypothetical protein